MVGAGNVDFSFKRLTSIEIRKSKYHIIRQVRFRWDPPPGERYLDPRLPNIKPLAVTVWDKKIFKNFLLYLYVKFEHIGLISTPGQ